MQIITAKRPEGKSSTDGLVDSSLGRVGKLDNEGTAMRPRSLKRRKGSLGREGVKGWGWVSGGSEGRAGKQGGKGTRRVKERMIKGRKAHHRRGKVSRERERGRERQEEMSGGWGRAAASSASERTNRRVFVTSTCSCAPRGTCR